MTGILYPSSRGSLEDKLSSIFLCYVGVTFRRPVLGPKMKQAAKAILIGGVVEFRVTGNKVFLQILDRSP